MSPGKGRREGSARTGTPTGRWSGDGRRWISLPPDGMGAVGRGRRVRLVALNKRGAAKCPARSSAGLAAAQSSGGDRQTPPLPTGSPTCRFWARFPTPAGKRPHPAWIAPARPAAAEPAGAAPRLPAPREGTGLRDLVQGKTSMGNFGAKAAPGAGGFLRSKARWGQQGKSEATRLFRVPAGPTPGRLSAGRGC